jgi:hypothetical protein
MGISSHLHISTKMRESFVLSLFLPCAFGFFLMLGSWVVLCMCETEGMCIEDFCFWVVDDVMRLLNDDFKLRVLEWVNSAFFLFGMD